MDEALTQAVTAGEPKATSPLRRALVLNGTVLLWVLAGWVAFMYASSYLPNGGFGYDAHAYWQAARADEPYGASAGERDAYLYSPAFLQLVTPVALLLWPAFVTVWVGVEVACFLWLTRPLRLRWRVPVLLLCTPEILFGNVYGLLGVMIVLGFRRPGLWACAFLTKVTIGLVGLLWFLARREWSSACWVVGTTAALTLVSLLLQPDLWWQWCEFLVGGTDGESHASRGARLCAALAVVVVAARRDLRWLLPVAMLLALPHFDFKLKDFTLLCAIPPLLARNRAEPSGR